MKVVWLCHFANKEISKHFGKENIPESAPWISQLIKIFENKNTVEVHIVAPNYFNNKNCSLKINGIYYHFFRYNAILIPPEHNELYLTLTNCKRIKNICDRYITNINPDIVHLFGSENLTYSPGVLHLINKFPVLVSIQGFVSLGKYQTTYWGAMCVGKRIAVENIINSSCNYFTSTSIETTNEIRKFNKDATVFKMHYPTTTPVSVSDSSTVKNYDIVYFAPVVKNKGIEDLIDALALLKSRGRYLTLLVIGKSSDSYLDHLVNKCKRLEILENVKFMGFLSSQQEVHRLAIQAKISVLPSYFDNMPGTIRESMYMKIPVVAYDIEGTKPFNKDKECITLAKCFDIDDLAIKILQTIDHTERSLQLVENAFDEITLTYDNNLIYSNILNIYDQIRE